MDCLLHRLPGTAGEGAALKLEQLLASIAARSTPPVILVGGNSDFLTDHAFGSIRDAIVTSEPSVAIELYPEVADLALALDSFRTMSLFGGKRLLIVSEVHAFVTRKEVATLYKKAVSDWQGAKTEKKRASAVAKMLHIVGLVGLDLSVSNARIADALGLPEGEKVLAEMLDSARASGKVATRGEGDAALLAEAVARGGAPGTTLLMGTGEIPSDSATLAVIEKAGVVIACDMTREQTIAILDRSIRELTVEYEVSFDRDAVARLRARLGIDRMLADKFGKEVPDVRAALSEAERLATLAGRGGKVTARMVDDEVAEIGGGARYELGALVTEGKITEAIVKLRDLVGQSRREEPSIPADIQYGRYIFALADEIRQMIGVHSFCALKKIDRRRPTSYKVFADRIAEPMGDYLRENGLVRQRPHPFPLYKKFEAVARYPEPVLIDALTQLAELDYTRKSGGIGAELGIDAMLLALPRP